MYIERQPKMLVAAARGFSLIELVFFIVVVGIGIAGVLSVMNITNLRSADPMARKQAISIAESLLEEINLQPFTLCAIGDLNQGTAKSASDCADQPPRSLGPLAGQSRSSSLMPFLQVGDYAGFTMRNGITAITGEAIPQLAAYDAQVDIINAAGPDSLFPDLPTGAVLRVTVNVTGAGSASLTGYRFRYDPNGSP